MVHSALIIFHVSAAVVGLIAGTLSMVFRKGSGLHRVAGTFFFVSMLCMSGSGAFSAAFLKPNSGNFMGGVLTFYLVATGWLAGRRSARTTTRADWGWFAVVTALAIACTTWGLEAARSRTALASGYPPAIYFVFGSMAWLFAYADVRMLLRGGVAGAQRIARHLWRMGLALLIALMSFFPGRAAFLPDSVRKSAFVYTPQLLLLGVLVYWLVRLGRKRAARERRIVVDVATAELADVNAA